MEKSVFCTSNFDNLTYLWLFICVQWDIIGKAKNEMTEFYWERIIYYKKGKSKAAKNAMKFAEWKAKAESQGTINEKTKKSRDYVKSLDFFVFPFLGII